MFKCWFRLTNNNSSSVSDFNRFLLAFNIRAAALKHLSMFADDEGTPIISRANKDKYLFDASLLFNCNLKNSIAGMNEINWPRWIRCVDSIGGSPIRVWSSKINLFCGAVIVFRPVFYETKSAAILFFASSSCVIL